MGAAKGPAVLFQWPGWPWQGLFEWPVEPRQMLNGPWWPSQMSFQWLWPPAKGPQLGCEGV